MSEQQEASKRIENPSCRETKRQRVERIQAHDGEISAIFKLLEQLMGQRNEELEYSHLFHFVKRHLKAEGIYMVRKYLEKAFPLALPGTSGTPRTSGTPGTSGTPSEDELPLCQQAVLTYLCYLVGISERKYPGAYDFRNMMFRKEMRLRFKTLKYDQKHEKFNVSLFFRCLQVPSGAFRCFRVCLGSFLSFLSIGNLCGYPQYDDAVLHGRIL